jgi:ferredoxin--NADP+ reductase
VIGTNRASADETVDRLLEDYRAGQLIDPAREISALDGFLRGRQPEHVSNAGWSRIDSVERDAGAEQGPAGGQICGGLRPRAGCQRVIPDRGSI